MHIILSWWEVILLLRFLADEGVIVSVVVVNFVIVARVESLDQRGLATGRGVGVVVELRLRISRCNGAVNKVMRYLPGVFV